MAKNTKQHTLHDPAVSNLNSSARLVAVEAMLSEARFDRGSAGECKSEEQKLIPKLDADKEFAVSALGLQDQFVNGESNAAEFLKAIIVADPKTNQEDFIEVSIGKEKFRFERRLNGVQLVWSLLLIERERLAGVMEWKLINGERISAPTLDDTIEFAISVKGLQSQFAIDREKTSKFIKTVIKADPKTHRQDFIEIAINAAKFRFERRLNVVQLVWSLPLGDRERLANVMEWKRQNGAQISAPKLNESIEFAISGDGLQSQFAIDREKTSKFIKTFIKAAPKVHQQDFMAVSIKNELFRFDRRMNGTQLAWSLPLIDRERFAGVMEWKIIDSERISAPKLEKLIEFAISQRGLQRQFDISQEKSSKFVKAVKISDPKTHQEDFIEIAINGDKFRFERRLNYNQHVWSLPLSERERLASAMNWEFRNRRPHTGSNLAALAAKIQAITKHAHDNEKRANE